MNINEVIKFPVLTEKTYAQMEKGVYTFAVDRRTNKSEVKKVVEFVFGVKVEKVNIFTVPKKPKRLGRFQGFTNAYKRSIVTLKEGQINIFPDDTKTGTTKPSAKDTQEESAKEVKETSSAEKRAAQKIAAKQAEVKSKVGEQKPNLVSKSLNTEATKEQTSQKAEPQKPEGKTKEGDK